MLSRSVPAVVLFVFVLLAGCDASAQRVPLAKGATETAEGRAWPTLEEIGIPLYPDLEAFMLGENPSADGGTLLFVNFASQADANALLAWYSEHAEGWQVDEDMNVLLPEGASIMDVMMGKTVFVNIYDAETIGGCFGGVPCKSMVQVVYKPAG